MMLVALQILLSCQRSALVVMPHWLSVRNGKGSLDAWQLGVSVRYDYASFAGSGIHPFTSFPHVT